MATRPSYVSMSIPWSLQVSRPAVAEPSQAAVAMMALPSSTTVRAVLAPRWGAAPVPLRHRHGVNAYRGLGRPGAHG